MEQAFTHLHVRTDFSFKHSIVTVDKLIDLAVKNNMTAVALTDLGTMRGIPSFYIKAREAGIKPIVGSEIQIIPDPQPTEEEIADNNLVVLCENRVGYLNLIQISSTNNSRISYDFLKEHSEGLIALSGNKNSEIRNHLEQDDLASAEKAVKRYQEIFGKRNFFLELVDHGATINAKLLPMLRDLSRKTGAPTVATNDVHMPEKGDLEFLKIYRKTGKDKDVEKIPKLSGPLVHFASAEEMANTFEDDPDALARTMEITDRIQLEIDFDTKYMPTFKTPPGVTDEDMLRDLTENGLASRYPIVTEEIRARVDYELKTIIDLKFASYFLICWDAIKFARSKDIPVGPGRGSCVGSIVSYCLDITTLDPLKYELLFERFLSPTRVSDPDIDIDICKTGREQILEYLREKYGRDKVAQIATFSRMTAKRVILDVGKVLGLPHKDTLLPFTKMMTNVPGIKLADFYDGHSAIYNRVGKVREYLERSVPMQEVWKISLELEGLHRHLGLHAAAVVIADAPLTSHIPLEKIKEKVATQYDMHMVEQSGILKMDFLGLKTLTVIKAATDILKKAGNGIDLDNIPLDDEATYEMLRRGDSFTVFQLGSECASRLLKDVQVSNFEELADILALDRPGPLGMGMHDTYVRRKNGEEEITYAHESIARALGDTYGVLIYQEQAMRIACEMAGFTANKADLLRKAMAKKIPGLMATFKKDFIEGSISRDVEENTAKKSFSEIETFSHYGFNKSHSIAYAIPAYQTAYLKANHPIAYMTACFICDTTDAKRITELIIECKKMKIQLLPPSVNYSQPGSTVVGNNRIRLGLTTIKRVGDSASGAIMKLRNEGGHFKDLSDFLVRAKESGKVHSDVLKNLAKAGALGIFDSNQAKTVYSIEKFVEKKKKKKKIKKGAKTDPTPEVIEEDVVEIDWNKDIKETYEYEVFGEPLGVKSEDHPFAPYGELAKTMTTCPLSDLQGFTPPPRGKEMVLAGIVTMRKVTLVQKEGPNKGKEMLKAIIEDPTGQCIVTLFTAMFKKYGHLIKEGEPIAIKGMYKDDKWGAQIVAGKVKTLTDANSGDKKEVHHAHTTN